jgi:hypothetical protein
MVSPSGTIFELSRFRALLSTSSVFPPAYSPNFLPNLIYSAGNIKHSRSVERQHVLHRCRFLR